MAKACTSSTAYVASGVLLVASALTAVAGVAQAASTSGEKVTICHRTNSNTNPYVQITVSVKAVDGKGKNDHTHHIGGVWDPTLKAQHIKWGDIIPSYDFGPNEQYDGMNLTPEGQAILGNGCKVPDPSFTLDKTGTPSGHPGDAVSYTVTLTQTGGYTTGPTTVTDTLPAGLDPGTMSYTSGPGNWTCAASASQTPNCNTIDNLNNGDVDVFTVTSAISADANPGDLKNCAKAVMGEVAAKSCFTTTVLETPPPNAPNASITKTGPDAVHTGDQAVYTLHLTISDGQGDGPTTGPTSVSDTVPAGLTFTSISAGTNDAATWTCSNADVPPDCTTNTILQPGYTHEFTVTTTAGNTPGTVENSTTVDTPGDTNSDDNTDTKDTDIVAPLQLAAECQQQVIPESQAHPALVPLTGNVEWTITNPNGNPSASGLTVVGATGASTPSPDPLDGDSESFFTTPGSQGSPVHVTATADGLTIDSNHLTFSSSCSDTPETPASVQFTDTCTGIDTTFTSASQHTTQFTVTKPEGGQDVVTGSDEVTYPANAGNAHINVAFDGGNVPHDWANPGDCAPAETPASVQYSDTCSGTTVTFTSASQHTTEFDVTTPEDGPDTVNGSTQKSYAADAAHAHLSMTFDNSNSSHDWVDPGNCTTPGQADPKASANNACKSGITVTLDNLAGTADASFSVTTPNGTVVTVPVRAGQLVKKVFAVAEDTTGKVTVTAPGLAKTFTYKKNCTQVLGEKKTKHHKAKKPVVQGEKVTRLPFTGFDSQRALLEGAALLLLGSLSCAIAGRRRRRHTA